MGEKALVVFVWLLVRLEHNYYSRFGKYGWKNGGRRMSLFRRNASAVKQLDEKLYQIQMNFENNYKDAAQINLKEMKALFDELQQAGKLSDRQKSYYSDKLEELNGRLKNFTHKDQKATWV